jgi:hypothetical protein
MLEVSRRSELGVLAHYEKYCVENKLVASDECPVCGYRILPEIVCELKTSDNITKYIVLTCPKCKKLYVEEIHYSIMNRKYYRFDTFPKIPKEVAFNDIIINVSEKFVEIYNQANKAEVYNLKEISGIGYRKALEFLIKDYLKGKLSSERSQEIEDKLLGKCISELIENENIKKVAKGATWIGNDETHYTRKWEDKDITDLKNLINLTVQWIILEKMTEAYQDDMNL